MMIRRGDEDGHPIGGEASHRTGEGGDGPRSNPKELLHHERALDQVRLQPGLPWMQIVVEGDDAASPQHSLQVKI